MDSPTRHMSHRDTLSRLVGTDPAHDETAAPTNASPKPSQTSSLSRSNTVSWQQRRPNSSAGRRPLSFASSDNPASKSSTPAPSTPAAEESVSRTEIARSLGSKDPSWFKQTPERGIGSPAYRRSQEDVASGADVMPGRRPLPAAPLRDSMASSAVSPPPDSARSSSPSRVGSTRDSAAWSNRFSRDTSVSGHSVDVKSSPLDSVKIPPPSEGDDGQQRSTISPSQARLSQDRPPSPTKGMGGFVQSAMMRRSDSQNKRWSVHTSGGLSRQNSTASLAGGLGGGVPKLEPTPGFLSREDGSVRHSLSQRHSRGRSVTSFDEQSGPSTKRWSRSPTKSSWLETALSTRAESPRQSQPPPQEPSWKAEISRIKAEKEKASAEAQKASVGDDATAKSDTTDTQGPATPASPTKFPRDASRGSAPGSVARPPDWGLSPSEEITDRQQPQAPESSKVSATSPRTTIKTPSSPAMETATETVAALNPKSPADKMDKQESSASGSPGATPTKRTPVAKHDAAPSQRPTDFRANLKSRAPPAGGAGKSGEQVAEFQNVFGKLKKTQQEKYVAPDTFTDNIKRGKAGLNETGGVPPRQKKDELRDSLVKQKESIQQKAKEGGHARVASSTKPPTATPEALKARRNLGRNDSMSKTQESSEEKKVPEALAKFKHMNKPSSVSKPPPDSDAAEPKRSSGKLGDRFNPGLAAMLARGPPPTSGGAPGARGSSGPGASASTEPPEAGSTKELTHATKGRAKGPKRRAPKAKSSAPNSTPASGAASPTKEAPASAAPSLMRKDILSSPSPPSEDVKDSKSSSPSLGYRDSLSKPRPVAPKKSEEMMRRVSARLESPKLGSPTEPTVPAKSPDLSKRISAQIEAKRSSLGASEKSETSGPAKEPSTLEKLEGGTPSLSKKSPTPPKPLETKTEPPREAAESAKSSPTPSLESPTKSQAASRIALLKQNMKDPNSTLPDSPKSVKSIASRASQQLVSPVSSGRQSPIGGPEPQKPAAKDPQIVSPQPRKPLSSSTSIGGTRPLTALAKDLKITSPEKDDELKPPTPAKDEPEKPPTPAKDAKFEGASSQSEAGRMFADFFEEAPVTNGKLDIDTNAILTADPLGQQKIKTLRKDIQEISGDGKLAPVPSQEEHILFDHLMYLCTHSFSLPNGSKSIEVYHWIGSQVPEPAVEDAQLFARKFARDAGGKLLMTRQGKETPYFFQALGGIVITRKGSRIDHSKEYMLCGRQHLGHMAFDEVDLSLSNLCSGFPFLISSRTGLLAGKVFLWKGVGCSAEELGCARLIGMDLGLTPEIEEVDEGKESDAFLEIFPAPDGQPKRIPRSADHWRLKARHEKYKVRLFRIDEKAQQAGSSFQVSSLWPALMRRVSAQSTGTQNGPQSPTQEQNPGTSKPNMTAEVNEIAPFSQADIEAENIYVLDAIVGALSRSQCLAFSTALMFAHEYGILAASLDDRPFVPVSTVVLEGVPRDMKACFRSWEDSLQPTAALMAGKPRRGRSLRIVGLQAALAATKAAPSPQPALTPPQ
ncbi:hypothetical protein IWZ01DRAFT_435672 [Phyllosticta capitalensis]